MTTVKKRKELCELEEGEGRAAKKNQVQRKVDGDQSEEQTRISAVANL